MSKKLIRKLLDLLTGWVAYNMILALTYFVWDLMYTGNYDQISVRINDAIAMLGNFLELTAAGFGIFVILYFLLLKNIYKEDIKTIALIIIFHILMMGSLMMSLYLLKNINPLLAPIELQFVFVVSTILVAVIPYLKKRIFE